MSGQKTELAAPERAAVLEQEIMREIGRAAALSPDGQSYHAHLLQSGMYHPAKIVYRNDEEGVAVVMKKRLNGAAMTLYWTFCSLGTLFWVYPLYRMFTRSKNRDKLVRIEVSPSGEVTKTKSA